MKRILLCLCLFLVLPINASASGAPETSQEVEAVVIDILSDREEFGFRQMTFTAETEEGNRHTIDTGTSYTEGLRFTIKPGTKVILQLLPNADGTSEAHLADVKRTNALFWIAVVFAVLVVLVGLWRGVFALIGFGITLGILFLFLLPQLLDGADPVLTTVFASILILGVNIPLAHGVSKTSLTALGGTILGLLIVVLSSKIFVSLANLSGLASEEAAFLFWMPDASIEPKGLLLAGMILGAVGVLDDIAIAQGEFVSELKAANPGMKKKELFAAAMRMGRHHIASTVNTLVLAYAGASLSLFLLFMSSSVSSMAFLNTEIVAEEIVRTLAGTVGLVLTVPIATILATHIKHD